MSSSTYLQCAHIHTNTQGVSVILQDRTPRLRKQCGGGSEGEETKNRGSVGRRRRERKKKRGSEEFRSGSIKALQRDRSEVLMVALPEASGRDRREREINVSVTILLEHAAGAVGEATGRLRHDSMEETVRPEAIFGTDADRIIEIKCANCPWLKKNFQSS